MLKGNNKFKLAVITYHNISDKTNYYTAVKFTAFRHHMTVLLNKFKYIDLNSAMNAYNQNKILLNRFSVTFDDGYEDILSALDWLHAKKAQATLFIPSDTIGKDNKWNYKATFINSVLNSDQIRRISAQGHIIGSHGKTHQCLTKLPDYELIKEIKSSQITLEKLINKNVNFFAYPYGYHDIRVRKITSRYYKAAFATNKTAQGLHWIDLYQIHRFSVNNDTGLSAILDFMEKSYAD